VDEDGKPVAGAKVFLSVRRESNIAKGILPASRLDSDRDIPLITDKNGVWTCERIFANADDASIRVTHPDFYGYPDSRKIYYDGISPIADLYKGRKIITLERGALLAGVVKDDKGKPVAGAEIFLEKDCLTEPPITKTDKQGKFSIRISKKGKNRRPWEATVSARAKGHAPDTKTISDIEEISNVELFLQPPQTIKGIVVNEKGEPLAYTWFTVESWKETRGIVETPGRSYTDKNGRFQLKDAPRGEVLFAFGQKGYADLRNFPLKAGAENKVVLIPITQVSGRVVDAATGEPIKNYTMDRGYLDNKEHPKDVYWEREKNKIKIDKSGNFQDELTWPQDAYCYRVFATGYRDAVSEPIKMDGKKHEIVFKLRKGKEVTLKVVDAHGQPAANAEVIFQNTGKALDYDVFAPLNFQNGKLVRNDYYKNPAVARSVAQTIILATDAAGSVTIQPSEEAWRIVISHDLGRAVIKGADLNANKPIVLSPWGHIKGKSFIGKKPNAGAKIAYAYMKSINILVAEAEDLAFFYEMIYPSWEASAIVDKNGNFEIKHALPGLGTVDDGTQNASIRIIQGEVLNLQLGGKGRLVEGKVVFQPDPKKEKLWSGGIELADVRKELDAAAKAAEELLPPAENSAGKKRTKAERDRDDLKMYEEEKKLQNQSFTANPDGTFRIRNVLPGKYVLTVYGAGPAAQQIFIVPPDPDGALLDTPLILPPVE
jgi:uncharacterized GH25 family protein